MTKSTPSLTEYSNSSLALSRSYRILIVSTPANTSVFESGFRVKHTPSHYGTSRKKIATYYVKCSLKLVQLAYLLLICVHGRLSNTTGIIRTVWIVKHQAKECATGTKHTLIRRRRNRVFLRALFVVYPFGRPSGPPRFFPLDGAQVRVSFGEPGKVQACQFGSMPWIGLTHINHPVGNLTHAQASGGTELLLLVLAGVWVIRVTMQPIFQNISGGFG